MSEEPRPKASRGSSGMLALRCVCCCMLLCRFPPRFLILYCVASAAGIRRTERAFSDQHGPLTAQPACGRLVDRVPQLATFDCGCEVAGPRFVISGESVTFTSQKRLALYFAERASVAVPKHPDAMERDGTAYWDGAGQGMPGETPKTGDVAALEQSLTVASLLSPPRSTATAASDAHIDHRAALKPLLLPFGSGAVSESPLSSDTLVPSSPSTPRLDTFALLASHADEPIVTPADRFPPPVSAPSLPRRYPLRRSPSSSAAPPKAASIQPAEKRRKRGVSEHLPLILDPINPDRDNSSNFQSGWHLPDQALRSSSPAPGTPWLHTHRRAVSDWTLSNPQLALLGVDVNTPFEAPGSSYFAIRNNAMDHPAHNGNGNDVPHQFHFANGHSGQGEHVLSFEKAGVTTALADPELEAAEALGDLRNASLSVGGSPMLGGELIAPSSMDFIARVANYPVVNSGIQQISRIYEAGKGSNKIVKFGAETVESVGTTVIKTLEPALGPSLRSLDRFATTSLDRLEFYVPSFKTGSPPREFDPSIPYLSASSSSGTFVSAQEDEVPPPPPSPGLTREGGYGGTQPLIQRKPQSKWSTIVTNVGGYVISEDTMRGLRYCLQWLQYATGLIDSRIQLLKSYLAKLVPAGPAGSSLTVPDGQMIAARDNAGTLIAGVKRDLVETLRNVVEIVGRYAAVVLPNESRDNVRQFILTLPARFSRLNAPGQTNEADTVLAFATESRTMLGGVENIFRQSFERAESVLSRIGFSTAGWNNPPHGSAVAMESGGPPQEQRQSEERESSGDDMEVDS